MLLLQEHDAISYCNYSSTALDWIEEMKKLKVMVYKIDCVNDLNSVSKILTFVERRGIQFLDACKLVYWCSCNLQFSSFITTLHIKVSKSFPGEYRCVTHECKRAHVCCLYAHILVQM